MDWKNFETFGFPKSGKLVLCRAECGKDNDIFYFVRIYSGAVFYDPFTMREHSTKYPITHWQYIEEP